MFNTIDFIRSSAEFMASDRPDIYDVETAIADLDRVMEFLRTGSTTASVSFTSYLMSRIVDEDGVEEFMFSRKLSGLMLFEQEATVRVYGYDDRIDLPSPLDYDDED